MTKDEFEKVDAELLKRCDEVLKQRGSAYANAQDRFANFKEIAQQVECSPLHVCHIYLLKGMSVINKLMRGENVPGEHEHERFADAINYLRLGYAMRQEMKAEIDEHIHGKQEPPKSLLEHAEEVQRLIEEGERERRAGRVVSAREQRDLPDRGHYDPLTHPQLR